MNRFVLFLAAFASMHCAASEPPDPTVRGKEILTTAVCVEPDAATCPGSPLPSVELEDVQPDSASVGTLVNLKTLEGQVTLIALFAGW